MIEFIHFLRLCARYASLWTSVFKNEYEVGEEPWSQVFDKLYSGLIKAENDLFVYAAMHGAYPLCDQEKTLNIIRKGFIMPDPTVVDCRIVPPRKKWSDPLLPHQVDHQASVVATMSDGKTHVLFRFFNDEIDFSPSEFIGLTEMESVELFHKKDVEYLREA